MQTAAPGALPAADRGYALFDHDTAAHRRIARETHWKDGRLSVAIIVAAKTLGSGRAGVNCAGGARYRTCSARRKKPLDSAGQERQAFARVQIMKRRPGSTLVEYGAASDRRD